MRFLVWDDYNDKLIGLIALGDPVFNLRARDNFICWGAAERKKRLINIMDAYVLGAVAPYNMLLGGKLVACLVRTKDIRDAFRAKYALKEGIISGEKKNPHLLAVTTSSALGRSSVYNRLHLGGQTYLQSLGFTSGFGHFHVPGELFEQMREYLRLRKHPYSSGNRFGNGPNWKFRAIRAALEMMGVKRDCLQHGIQREVFISLLASNAVDMLRGIDQKPRCNGLLSVQEVGQLAVERWLRPRAQRRPEFIHWHRDQVAEQLAVPQTITRQACGGPHVGRSEAAAAASV